MGAKNIVMNLPGINVKFIFVTVAIIGFVLLDIFYLNIVVNQGQSEWKLAEFPTR